MFWPTHSVVTTITYAYKQLEREKLMGAPVLANKTVAEERKEFT